MHPDRPPIRSQGLVTAGMALAFLAGSVPGAEWAMDASTLHDGEPWRAAAAHVAHLDATHALLNALLASLVFWIAAPWAGASQIAAALGCAALATTAGLTLLTPSSIGYVGASASLWGAAFGLSTWLAARPGGGSAWTRAVAAALATAISIRLSLPLSDGAVAEFDPLTGLPVHHLAHAWGLVGGALFAAAAIVAPPWRRSAARLVGGAAVTLALAGAPAATAQVPPPELAANAAGGRMLYRDTPLLRGSINACVQCHANPAAQQRGANLVEQQDHIRCAIQGGCGGATQAVYPLGGMAQFQTLLSPDDLLLLATYIRYPTVTAPYPRLAPSRADLGTLETGSTARAVFAFENRGEVPLSVSALRLDGPSEFRIASSGCRPGDALAPGARCEIGVEAIARCTLPREARLVIEHDGPLGPSTVRASVTGRGSAQPDLAARPTALEFSGLAAGQATQSITLTNVCGGTSAITSVSVTGPFVRIPSGDDCEGARLSAGQSCRIDIAQAPDAGTDAATGTLRIASSGTASLLEVPLRRTAAAATALAADRTEFRIDAPVQVGASLGFVAATIRNAGQATMSLQSITVAGAGFSVDSGANGPCAVGSVLVPGAQCQLAMRFSPAAAGSYEGRIELAAAPGVAGVQIKVFGTAIEPPRSATAGGAASPVLLLAVLLLGLALRRLSI